MIIIIIIIIMLAAPTRGQNGIRKREGNLREMIP